MNAQTSLAVVAALVSATGFSRTQGREHARSCDPPIVFAGHFGASRTAEARRRSEHRRNRWPEGQAAGAACNPFAEATGYRAGEPGDWASVSRFDAVEVGLVKRGVRAVRFLAKDGDTRQLVDYEHLAPRVHAHGKAQRKTGNRRRVWR